MRSALFDSAWGSVALGLSVGCLTLFAALAAFAKPRTAWLKNRLEPYGGSSGSGAIVEADEGPWRPSADRFYGMTERLLGKTRLWMVLARMLERANMQTTPAELVSWSVAAAIAASIAVKVVGASTALALFVGVVVLVFPSVRVVSKGQKRRKAFEDQLPDVLLTMAGSLRVGQSFNNSMRAIVDEGQAPASEEFGRVLAETRLGRPMDDALLALANRVDSEDLRFVLMSVTIQREVGGSLAEFFSTVSDTVRERQHFRRKVRALTSLGRASASLLLGLPFVTGGLIALVGGGYLTPLFTTSIGRTMVGGMLVLMVIGTLVIRKIVDIKG
jgi:tight adherence protein B